MFKVPNKYRIRKGMLGSTDESGNNGAFIIPFKDFELIVITSNGEEWAGVKGYHGLYQIATSGKILSLEKNVSMPNNATRKQSNFLLKPNKTKEGYYRVSLSKNGNTKKFLLHRLVAENFIENKSNAKVVNHIDGNTKNSNVENLEWCSSKHNTHHAIENKLMRGHTKEYIEKIQKMLKTKTPTEIANELELSKGTIFDIKFNRFRDLNYTEKTSKWTGTPQWEHVSVSLKDRTPSWEEMCIIKDLFWNNDDCVVQYHPPKTEYINNCDTCLPLWKPINKQLETPPSILVGVK